jgi:LruC domain-containing protein
MQDTVAKLYGVNLVTGNFALLSDNLGTSNKINGVGFNFHDNYIYGWGYEWGTIVQIGSDYQATPITIDNNPGVSFYVGDIAVNENTYYFYRKDANYGLYKVSLDDQHSDYLKAIKVVDSSTLNINIYDFAFHPTNGFLYTVDRQGQLQKINTQTGINTQLGNVGQSGTFGAVYFDVDGKLYISQNTDGYVYSIDVDAQNPQAVFFAYGPASSQNDGARCAMAPVVDESVDPTTDYGDAPDSYGTTLFNNGARHGESDNYLGSSISFEHTATVYPAEDQDDGLVFLTPLIAGQDSLLQVQATGSGYLNVWGDFNRDGVFSTDEKLLSDRFINNTTESFLVQSPVDALNGFTWIRARLSSLQGIVASGGVSDGEVEDYRIFVTNPGNSQIQDTPFYIAFEDRWPEKGDYDMNDVVIKQNSSVLLNDNQEVKQIEFTGDLKASGASYRNGFAIQLDNVLPSNVNPSLVRFWINGVLQNTSPIETDTEFLVIKITEDISSHIELNQACPFYKTDNGCSNSSQFNFSVTVPFITPIAYASFPEAPYNPFIFAMPSMYHGDSFFHPGRSLEIHLKNKMPTSKADLTMFGVAQDNSNVANGITYQTANGLPWALAINPGAPEEWQHPLEKVDLLSAYPDFEKFVESDGNQSSNWFLQQYADSTKTYNN